MIMLCRACARFLTKWFHSVDRWPCPHRALEAQPRPLRGGTPDKWACVYACLSEPLVSFVSLASLASLAFLLASLTRVFWTVPNTK